MNSTEALGTVALLISGFIVTILALSYRVIEAIDYIYDLEIKNSAESEIDKAIKSRYKDSEVLHEP